MKNLNLTLIFLFASLLSFATISNTEKEALVALHTSTNGEQWTKKWDLTADVNSWYGVTIENDKIVELNLAFNNLNGTLPNELGNLVSLRKINLGFNKLSGELPNSLSNLKALTSIELFMNKLEGNIPLFLGELKNLEVLALYSNSFSGNIPSEIAALSNLKELELGSNFLTGNRYYSITI